SAPRYLHSFPTRRSSDLLEPERHRGLGKYGWVNAAWRHSRYFLHPVTGLDRLGAKPAAQRWQRAKMKAAAAMRVHRTMCPPVVARDRKSTRLNSSHVSISYA